MQNGPLVSVIIPYFNASETLRTCLESVYRSTYKNIQLITVDDGSTDDTYRTIADLPCHHIALGRQSGAATARNVGAHAAEGEILFFLDADVLMLEDTIGQVVQTLADDQDLSAVFGEYTIKTYPNNFTTVYKNMIHHYTHQTSSEQAVTFWCGCGAIYTKAFRRVGMFDESYSSASVEDIDLGYRLHQAGYRIRLNKSIRVTHCKKYSALSLIRSDVMNRAIPWTKLMARNNIFRADLNLKWNNIASGLLIGIFILWFAYALFFSHPWEMLYLVAALLAGFGILNFGILFYVARKKGPVFMLGFAGMYIITYLYSILGFGLGLLLYAKDKIQAKERV